MLKLVFFSGARSEYGIMRRLLFKLSSDPFFDISILVGGLHLLKEFGNTINEIEADGFHICERLAFFEEGTSPTHHHFIQAIAMISEALQRQNPNFLFIIGDRFESYAASLAAHFTKIKVIHFGGGTITSGSLDNIYRYNITNLSNVHFATSKGNYKRLLSIPIIQKEKVYFSGSIAIDAIKEFQKSPLSIKKFIMDLTPGQFVLITFHPSANKFEKLSKILKKSVYYLLEKKLQVLITYPNNDPGYEPIIESINSLKNIKNVFTVQNLGALGYYAALNDCFFVLGNSSSGIIEAPYFKKKVINIGDRQSGREKDTSIVDVNANWSLVKKVLEIFFADKSLLIENNDIYGDGNSIYKVTQALKKEYLSDNF